MSDKSIKQIGHKKGAFRQSEKSDALSGRSFFVYKGRLKYKNMEEKIEIIDKRKKPAELEIVEFLVSKGIYNLEQIKELLEPNFYAVIPISILEKKTISANAKLLYAEIMALSKKSGKCFATNEYLAERLGISKRTIPSLLKELRDDLLIQVSIKRDKDGTYRDITLSLIGDGGHRQNTIRGIAKERGQKRIKQIELDKENIDIVANATESFSFESELNKLLSSKDRKLQIIGLYWKFTGIAFPSYEAYQAGLRRELRPAKNLVGYPLEQIISIFDYLDFIEKNEGWLEKWTLETVHKFIDRVNWVPRDSTFVENLKRSLEIN
jgi:hypothetical protein